MLPIDGSFEGEVDLHLSLRDQCFVLLNSLLLPLLISLVFAFVADYLHLSEIYGIISAVCGFSIGVLWCRRLKPDALTVKQVHRG